MNQAILDAGNKVGDLAMSYFGDFTEVPYNEEKSVMIAETRRLLKKKTKTICEASFAHNGNFCSVDILRVFGASVEIVEVKSSTGIKPIYLDDMAYQYYVLAGCGLAIRKISLMYINSAYVRQGELDLKSLFAVEDCTGQAAAMQSAVAANITEFGKIAACETEPVRGIGEHCFNPYECVYRGYCWRHIPENSVFDVTGRGIRLDKKFDLYRRGIITFEEILSSGEKIAPAARLQIESEVKRLPPAIDPEAIRAFLDGLSWPLYFLDFESCQNAVPQYDGMRPYMQIPFQYSIHIQEKPGAPLEHCEFLAEEGTDPRRALAERLCADIPSGVCIIAWNMSFEKGRIKELAGLFTGLSAQLMIIHDNIHDLMSLFRSRAYYSREFHGSYSIKQVLPALCPNDSELDYHGLSLVHNGGEAQTAYAELSQKTPEERAELRAALLAYCRLDTLGMVKILEKLQKLAGK
jgi:hypothetical protein